MAKHYKLIIILCLISSLARFVLDSFLPSMPSIAGYFSIPGNSSQYTITFYLLGFTLSQLIYGPLSDHYGRRITVIIGLLIFLVGNLLCAAATTFDTLLIARLIAGIGGGACGVLNRAIASDCFKGKEFSKVWSYTTTTLVITLCVAPILGGHIEVLWGWRANFMVVTAYAAIVFAIILKYLPETHARENTWDITGGLNIQTMIKNYYIILKTPSFITGALCYTLAFSGLIVYFQVSPLLLIKTFGLSPVQYGWFALVIALNYLAGGLIVNQCVNYFGTRYLMIAGAILLILSGVLLVFANLVHAINLTDILIFVSIYVLGARIVIPNAIANCMEEVRHLNGSSSALIGFIQMLGSTFASFLMANFNEQSSWPLALFFSVLGVLTLSFALLNTGQLQEHTA
jgi:Bcr/CflA subfamily drug resistance transporter